MKDFKLEDRQIIRNKTIRNRIVMPAMICNNWGDKDGFQTEDRASHYGKRAKGGTGLIIVEASAVSENSKIEETSLGIWKDDHIGQFKKIGEACHGEGATVLVQLAHAGPKPVSELTIQDIKSITENFIEAAVRAEKAGLDGVEIHGAHGFLINQFTSKIINNRGDAHGGCPENRFRLSLEILKGIRERTSEDFIISYRLGVNDPTFQEDILLARRLQERGADILNVSYGIGMDEIEVPPDFPLSPITYLATVIKKRVTLPVVAVNLIQQPEEAKWLLSNKLVDFVAVGRGQLADPRWADKAIKGQRINPCLLCKSWCKFGTNGKKCPALKLADSEFNKG